ncbi:type II toxin-antitoxin system VapC family toxin [Gordonia sp. (in: high G+C Gram-positive bacteria)]|uniref:type II toxin-antitoxin system VapC family toxin n=1 Tax=Gordonia sp. (in: high G+C Gram-positive bacteria) TaxID=84139 RepID=UPI001D2D1380|nr:type II toxin-antitoxin system VapC family toxin [Gordonia sp. (in: high G+C Gram-positive bacteria)]MCB1296389.1 type II toxin-antitoxin system VapC family toxin [Gordonia sp. (in: high G+C Gram-positive bacteria)]HMS74419.1 type II toxin-antitoxin system VapC family toxin [Gordonia sp. (in: high G+C Gram-positive bacteria)]HQV19973.1 type II toxin-antitoxin system VapC family toxin [Gordonia sp. (in: high G+C Gram-positive bacteria)]
MKRVIDASTLVDALLPVEAQLAARRTMKDHKLWAPSILDMEVMSAVWRLERTSAISPQEASRAVQGLRTAPIRRIDCALLLPEAWAMRTSVRVSDAFYVATARLLGADLVTSDARLARAHALGITVILPG